MPAPGTIARSGPRWPDHAIDVCVREAGRVYGGRRAYTVEVDGRVLDQFTATGHPLTWSQMIDVAQGYREAING
jgi:hypothetical protein